MVQKIDFFIAGVQKGGTTALDAYLREHPGIQMASIKEVHHFDNEDIDWSQPSHDGLHSKFDWSVQGVMRGEATPIYTYWPESLARLKHYNATAKLIIGLRHPTFRAWSHWRMETKRGNELRSFGEAVRDVAPVPHRVFSYLDRGFYSEQVKRLHGMFLHEQVHFFRTDHLWNDPGPTLDRIEKFLGINDQVSSSARRCYTVAVDARQIGRISPRDRIYLDALFEGDIAATAEMTGIELSDWLKPDYEEPMEHQSRAFA